MNLYADKIILPGVGAFEDAARKLRDKGILAIEKINDSKFDHTYSYAFTEFGCDLMIDEGCLF